MDVSSFREFIYRRRGKCDLSDDELTNVLFSMQEKLAKAISDTDKNPSAKEISAGNAKKGKFTWNNLRIAIENPKGTKRKKRQTPMQAHYGYFLRTTAEDSDQVDVFVGPNLDSNKVFVIDQNNKHGEYDESKVMIGFDSEQEALEAYLGSFDDNHGQKIFDNIRSMNVEKLKQYLREEGNATFSWPNPYAQSWWMSDAFGGCCVYNESARNHVQPWGVLSWLIAGSPAVNLSNLEDSDIVHRCVDSLPSKLRELGQRYFIEGQVKRWLGTVNGDPAGFPTKPPKQRHILQGDDEPRIFMVGDYLFDSTLNGVMTSASVAVSMLVEEANHVVISQMID